MLRFNGYYKSSNKIPIKRDTIKLEYLDYTYTGVDIELDEDNNSPYEDEFTHENDKFVVPEKSYYNEAERVYFDSNELDDRFKFCQLRYDLIPKIVELPYIFIQDSSHESLARAEEREKQVREDWKDRFSRCCVDTINYDPWIVIVDKLEKLIGKWSKLGGDSKDMFELPPYELTDRSDETCEKCKKPKNECTCEDMKLCTKCYPLDLYGTAGKENLGKMTGENDASIYGLFTACGYMYDQSNHALTFAEIAQSIYSAIFVYSIWDYAPLEAFSVMSNYSLSVLCVTYPMIQSCYQFQIGGTVANMFSAENWDNFLKQYSSGLALGRKMDTMKFSNEFKVGVADGYAYIPTGYTIVFEYNPMTYQFNIKGASSAQTAMLATLAFCEYDQYMSMWKPIAKACEPLSDDMKKFIAYPYMPSIKSIIFGEDDDIDNPDEYEEKYIYVADPNDVSIATFGLSTGSIQIRFKIYIKRPVLCSYPKTKVPTCRQKCTEGYCGLREMFEKPLIVCPYTFDLEKEILKKQTRRKRIMMKKISEDLKKDTQSIKDGSCDVTKNLQRIDEINDAAMSEVIDFANDKKNLFSKVGRDKTDGENQESPLCEAIMVQKLKSIMEDYDMVFNQSIFSIELIGDESFDKTKEAIADMVKDFVSINDSLKKSLIEIAAAFPIFMICNKKYNDYLTDQNIAKSYDTDILQLVKENYAKDLNRNISNRIGNNAISENVKKLENLKKSVKNDLIDDIKSTNFGKLKTTIDANADLKNLLNDERSLDGKVVSLLEKATAPAKDQKSLLAGLTKDITANLSPASCMKTMKEKFTNPMNLMKGLTAAADIAKCAGKMSTAITTGIIDGIKKTVRNVIYPLLGCEVPSDDEGAQGSNSQKSGKDSIIGMTGMSGYAESMSKFTDISSLADPSKLAGQSLETIAEMICTSLTSTIMSTCGTYLTTGTAVTAAMGGIAGALNSTADTSERLKADTIAGSTQYITGILNMAIEKTGLKEVIKVTMDGIISTVNAAADSAKSTTDSAIDSAKSTVKDETGSVVDDAKSTLASKLDKALSESSSIDATAVTDATSMLGFDDATTAIDSATSALDNLDIPEVPTSLNIPTDSNEATDAIMDSLPKINPAKASEGAKNICDDLPVNVGEESGKKLDEALDKGIFDTVLTVKDLVEKDPIVNEIVSSILKKENGETADAMLGFANGTSSFSVEKQDEENILNAVANGTCNTDAMTQSFKFINDNIRLYEQLTGEIISLDSN